MAKTFYTERDIEDFHRRGVMVIDINDDTVLTDVAREKALSLGIRLARPGRAASAAPGQTAISPADVAATVKAAVIARLGNDVDAALLDAVISRVLAQLK